MTNNNPLPYSTPEAQGISSSAILAFVEQAEREIDALHSFMFLRHGHLVAQGWWAPYTPEHPHMLFSLSKSFTSTAVGLAVAEGRLSVDDTVLSFFPAEAPAEVGSNLASMRVRHLLSMSSGHAQDTTGHLFGREDGDWVKAFLAQPVEHEPGTHFVYNSGATYMLSAIVQKVTGSRVLDYLQPRLFGPLGIENATWETCPRGINTGGWGLNIKTEDIARFGQLYLQKGLWEGQRLLPAAWVEAASSKQVSNGTRAESDWDQGYGYQFWRCRHGAYRGDGAFGQYCVVMPDQDAVLAITSGLQDMQAVLNLIWTHLLPAMGPASLASDQAAHATLSRKLAGLRLPPAQGQSTSPEAVRVSGQHYAFAANASKIEAVSFDLGGERDSLTFRDHLGEHKIACGHGAWLKGMTLVDDRGPHLVAASGAWSATDTFTIKLCSYETPFCSTITARFLADTLKLSFKTNVSFGPNEALELEGRTTPA